jgi:hypothetical protein
LKAVNQLSLVNECDCPEALKRLFFHAFRVKELWRLWKEVDSWNRNYIEYVADEYNHKTILAVEQKVSGRYDVWDTLGHLPNSYVKCPPFNLYQLN